MERVLKPISFEARPHPLGCEIEVKWGFEEKLPADYQLFIFKRSKIDVSEEEIDTYLSDPKRENVAKGLNVYYNLKNEQYSFRDTLVESGQEYFYKAIVVDKNDFGHRSEIESASTKAAQFDAKIEVVDAKSLVIEAVKKILRGIAKQTNADLMVYNEFPLEITEVAYVVVTRSSGENAYRSLSDMISNYGDHIKTGDIDSDVIQIVWLTNNNPTLRDKFTNIFRGTKRLIKRHLRSGGALDATLTVIGDGAEEMDGKHMVYGSMLVNTLIENAMVSGSESELLEKITYEFNFTNKPLNSD